MNNITVLRTERDGVEFFTVVATGESGMSQSGLAQACGVNKSTINRLVEALTPLRETSSKTLKSAIGKGSNPLRETTQKKLKPSTGKGFNPVTKAPSEWLQPFVGKDLNLSGSYEKNGGVVKVYTAEFCVAVIKHYAYSGSKAAQDFDSSLGVIGLTSYIQSQTGWLPEEFKAAPKEHDKLDRFLSLAMEWDRGVMMVVDWDSYYADLADLADNSSFYEEQGVNIPIKLEDYEVDMSDSWTFFDAVVFSGFTPEEFIKFQNETKELGLQKHSKSEQVNLFFNRNPEIKERMRPYTEVVEMMLTLSKNPQLFLMAFFAKYGCDPDELYSQLEPSAEKWYTSGFPVTTISVLENLENQLTVADIDETDIPDKLIKEFFEAVQQNKSK